MKKIWKYMLNGQVSKHEIPEGGVVRYVDAQHGRVCVWVEVDPSKQRTIRCFRIYGTGSTINDEGEEKTYLGSAKLGSGDFIFNVYEQTDAEETTP